MRRYTGLCLVSGLVACSGCVARGVLDPASVEVPTTAPIMAAATDSPPTRVASFRKQGTDVASPIAHLDALADQSSESRWDWDWFRSTSMDATAAEAPLEAQAVAVTAPNVTARNVTAPNVAAPNVAAPNVAAPNVAATVAPERTTDAEIPHLADAASADVSSSALNVVSMDLGVVSMDLGTALAAIGGQTPAVGFAQWRVQQAYAELDRARVLWLPTIQTGFSFHRHDGNYQASNGAVVDINRNSFQYGLGTGAVAAGTTPRPGVAAAFHLSDALFQPAVSQRQAWAAQHSANAVTNQQLLQTASTFLELLRAYQSQRMIEESRIRTAGLAKITSDFAASGQGLQADADRMRTELALIESRLAEAAEQIGVASASLAAILSLDYGQQIVPSDPTVIPIDLVPTDSKPNQLIPQALAARPELRESQSLVSAACKEYERQKYRPFIPSMLLGFSTGGFGGGLGNDLDNISGRYDFDAALTWQARNLGFGEAAARRGAHSAVQQARFNAARVMDQVAREVTESHTQVVHRLLRVEAARRAIESAQQSYDRNLRRIRESQGLPIEVLQSIRALEDAQRAYLDAVVDYNRAQFRLQWALGWPVTAPADDLTAK